MSILPCLFVIEFPSFILIRFYFSFYFPLILVKLLDYFFLYSFTLCFCLFFIVFVYYTIRLSHRNVRLSLYSMSFIAILFCEFVMCVLLILLNHKWIDDVSTDIKMGKWEKKSIARVKEFNAVRHINSTIITGWMRKRRGREWWCRIYLTRINAQRMKCVSSIKWSEVNWHWWRCGETATMNVSECVCVYVVVCAQELDNVNRPLQRPLVHEHIASFIELEWVHVAHSLAYSSGCLLVVFFRSNIFSLALSHSL